MAVPNGLALVNKTATGSWRLARLSAAPAGYWLAWLSTVAFFAGFYSLLVPLPRYLAVVGLPDWQIGSVLGAFGIASLVGRPIAGMASDRFGARPVMLAGAVSLTLGALGVASTASVFALFGLRVLQAVGYVAFTTAGTALVVSLVPPAERASRLAVFGAAANLAISLAPAASAALLEVAPLAAGLLAAAAFAALGGTLALFLPRTSTSTAASASASTSTSIDQLQPVSHASLARSFFFAKRRYEASRGPSRRASRGDEKRHVDVTNVLNLEIWQRLWLPMLATVLLGAGFAAFFQFAPILADRRGVSSGALYTVYGAAIIATRFLGGGLLDRIRVGRSVSVAAGLMAVGHLVIASSDGLAPLLLAAGLIATGGGLFHPTLIAYHATLLPDTPGRASAAFYLAFDLGIGLGSWLFGFMLQLGGLAGLYWTAAALTGVVLLLARRLSGGPASVAV